MNETGTGFNNHSRSDRDVFEPARVSHDRCNTVYVVDDDASLRVMIGTMVRELGYRHHPFAGGKDFCEALGHLQNGCVLVDLHMPDVDGLAVLKSLAELRRRIPAVMITGQPDIPTSVSAIKLGANDVLVKPFTIRQLQSVLEAAFATIEVEQAPQSTRVLVNVFADRLTERQLDVLSGMIEGRSNKAIANWLEIAPRTVEMHRANLMQKLDAKNIAEVLRLVLVGDTHATD